MNMDRFEKWEISQDSNGKTKKKDKEKQPIRDVPRYSGGIAAQLGLKPLSTQKLKSELKRKRPISESMDQYDEIKKQKLLAGNRNIPSKPLTLTKEQKELNVQREQKEQKTQMELKELKMQREQKAQRDLKEFKMQREQKAQRDLKEFKMQREQKAQMDLKELKMQRELKEKQNQKPLQKSESDKLISPNSMKEINKKQKVEEWLMNLKSAPQIKTKSRKGSSSSFTAGKLDVPKESKPIAKPQQKVVLVVESDSSDSLKENKKKLKKLVESKEQNYKIPTIKKTQIEKREEQSVAVSIKKEEKYYAANTEKQNGTNKNKKEDKEESPKCKQEVKQSPKKMRPVSFVLKPSGVSMSTQTDISSANLKDLAKCEMSDRLRVEYKFIVDCGHDIYARRREDNKFCDKKGEDLTPWIEYIIDNYKPKNKSTGNEKNNCFITLNSRFKVLLLKEISHIELLHVEDDDSNQITWMRDVSDPIRVHTILEKDIYGQFLGIENTKILPDVIVTRIFPKSSK